MLAFYRLEVDLATLTPAQKSPRGAPRGPMPIRCRFDADVRYFSTIAVKG